MPILLLPLVYFIVDIVALLMLGHAIGLLPTLLLIVITGFIGSQLIKRQGIGSLRNIQQGMATGQVNKADVIKGGSSVIAGFLLLMPGPISDLLGVIALIPLISRKLMGKPPVEIYNPRADRGARGTYDGESRAANDDAHASSGDTIEGEFIEHKKDDHSPH
ncbi:FxsA family protein [Carnimonas bestiolae]|uniref:FxsA family protein n=1 Tax=Carnimonas bestiolae TaxID=3402172 RepID=UPI003EDB9559